MNETNSTNNVPNDDDAGHGHSSFTPAVFINIEFQEFGRPRGYAKLHSHGRSLILKGKLYPKDMAFVREIIGLLDERRRQFPKNQIPRIRSNDVSPTEESETTDTATSPESEAGETQDCGITLASIELQGRD